jgi:hypothetical protein
MERLVAKAAKVSSNVAFVSNWVTNVEVAKTAKLPNIIGIVASIVDFRNVWRWE